MANPNVIQSVEHYGIAPRDYSNSDYQSLVVAETALLQTYGATNYTGVRFDNYAGIVVVLPPSPIYNPSEARYDGIAPIDLQPKIDPPYPWEIPNATYY